MKRLLLVSVSAALFLAGCGSSSDDDSADAKGGEAWSYTSGDGKTYDADSTPTRIIAHGPAAAALISFGIKPIAIYSDGPVDQDKSLKDLDLSGIEILSETYGQIDAEKAAGLKPDLIVASYWPLEKAYSGFEAGVEDSAQKVKGLADVVGPAEGDSVVTKIEGYEELAQSLGADTTGEKIAADKATFQTAVERFRTTVASKEGLTSLAVSPAEDLLYVAVPSEASELSDFTQWGLDIMTPDSPDPDFAYWENLSWENADKYQPDFVLMDDRDAANSLEVAQGQPTWQNIKAVGAGAVVPWPAYWMNTYRDYTDQLDQLSTAIEKIDPNLT